MAPGSGVQVLAQGPYEFIVKMFHTVALQIIYGHRNISC